MANNVILVTGSYDHNLMFWDAFNCQPTHTIDYGEKSIINKIDISPDKKHLACGANFYASYYDIASMKSVPVHVFDGFKNNITGIGYLKDGTFIYSCSEDGYVRLHDLRQNVVAREFQEKEAINTIALHPNETELIFGDQVGNIKIYDFQQNKIRMKINPCPDIGIRSITMACNASQFVAADSLGFCHQYSMQNMDINADNPYYKFEAHQDYILKVLISSDLKYLATCSADKIVKLWTLNEKNEKIPKWQFDKNLFGHSRWVWDCAFSCDSEYVITVSSDQFAKIWQCDNGDVLRNLKAHKMAVNCIALNDVAQE